MPTLPQRISKLKTIAWDYLQHYSRPIPGIQINQSQNYVLTTLMVVVFSYSGVIRQMLLRGIYLGWMHIR